MRSCAWMGAGVGWVFAAVGCESGEVAMHLSWPRRPEVDVSRQVVSEEAAAKLSLRRRRRFNDATGSRGWGRQHPYRASDRRSPRW